MSRARVAPDAVARAAPALPDAVAPHTAAPGGVERAAPAVPADHLDLLTRPLCAVFTTMGRDGRPQSSLVWVDFDGECARVNTTLERQKGRNLLADPRVSLLVVDPQDTARFIQIRGDAELVRDGALEHLDSLTRQYTGRPRYYGHVYPLEQQSRETRVICRIHARRITLDAIHA
jgi:PPOX class probable F420-dependent enzyme